MWSERQAIELFHLVFVIHLGKRVDKALFAIKGGCNLRFYCKSIRYSEDIDFDIRTMARATLENNVDTILASKALADDLRAKQITIEHVTSAKQTSTTQRWKLGIQVGGGPSMPTKIEFSRRKGLDPDHKLEAVDPGLVGAYQLYPVLAQHYSNEMAFRQKIVALSRRNETQARDIFDLKLLLDGGAGKAPLSAEVKKEIPAAIENALTIGFDDFSGQVRAFLLPEYFAYYAKAIWEDLQAAVVARLEALA
ncbi:MAG: nucleotidyl transferase AbiEii/AbiGii toxin family protein [bacterium]|nr:nucleotidyl transferase AbiEii/AbiGii toxin family protein [bacterium]MDI1337524.1 nucleotidyl transferase AbiEii/AbiGii toxin family protein [Lacunisphaera sp.]